MDAFNRISLYLQDLVTLDEHELHHAVSRAVQLDEELLDYFFDDEQPAEAVATEPTAAEQPQKAAAICYQKLHWDAFLKQFMLSKHSENSTMCAYVFQIFASLFAANKLETLKYCYEDAELLGLFLAKSDEPGVEQLLDLILNVGSYYIDCDAQQMAKLRALTNARTELYIAATPKPPTLKLFASPDKILDGLEISQQLLQRSSQWVNRLAGWSRQSVELLAGLMAGLQADISKFEFLEQAAASFCQHLASSLDCLAMDTMVAADGSVQNFLPARVLLMVQSVPAIILKKHKALNRLIFETLELDLKISVGFAHLAPVSQVSETHSAAPRGAQTAPSDVPHEPVLARKACRVLSSDQRRRPRLRLR